MVGSGCAAEAVGCDDDDDDEAPLRTIVAEGFEEAAGRREVASEDFVLKGNSVSVGSSSATSAWGASGSCDGMVNGVQNAATD